MSAPAEPLHHLNHLQQNQSQRKGQVFLGRLSAAVVGPAARAAGAVFCSVHPLQGVLLVIALALVPTYLLCALLAAAGAQLLARSLNYPVSLITDASLTYNVFLSALAVAWLARGSGIETGYTALLLVSASVAAFVLSAAMLQWLPRALGLPPLSIAFTLVFVSLITILPRAASDAMLAAPIWAVWPDWVPSLLTGFLRSLGTVLFLTEPLGGVLVGLAVFLTSPLMLVFAFTGYMAGMGMAALLSLLGVHFVAGMAAHNFLLAGLIMGAVYFVPSRASLLLAAFAGATASTFAAIFQQFFHGSVWFYPPLPFIATVWVLLSALRLRTVAGALKPVHLASSSAEQNWRLHAREQARFNGSEEVHLLLPSAAVMSVTQGFDGQLSHRGDWRHALDLELHDASGAAHANKSDLLVSDFYTFGAEVLAPDHASVMQIESTVPDNPPGGCNYAHNWGNHIVLRLDSGVHVTLAHLREGGVRVAVGDRVAAGQVLGECGNSGRSPVPHLHLQVQSGPYPGAATLPFRLANYLLHEAQGARWCASGIPAEGSRVSAAVVDAAQLNCLARMAPGRRVYKIRRDDGSSTVEVIDCALDEAGRHVFTGQGGKLVALAGLHAWNVMDCEAGKSLTLCLMGLGLARAPYANAPNMWWQDQVDWAGPGDSLRARIERTVGGMIGPFTHWRGQHLVSRYLASGRQDRVQIQTTFETPARPAGARAVDIKITLEPVKGVTEIDARWGDESFHIQLTSFEVATYS